MARLPEVGQDHGEWGNVLNRYLTTSLNPDGTLKPITFSQVIGLQSELASKASIAQLNQKYTKPVAGIPIEDLDQSIQTVFAQAGILQSDMGGLVVPTTSQSMQRGTSSTSAMQVDAVNDPNAPLPYVLKGKFGGLAELDQSTRVPVTQSARSIQVGVHFPGYGDSTGLNTTLASLQTLEGDLRFTSDYVLLFQSFGVSANYTTTHWQDIAAFLDNGTQVVLNFELLGNLAEINNGSFDRVIGQLGQAVLGYVSAHPEWQHKLIVKFLHEGNLTVTYPWCVYASTNLSANNNSVPQTAAQYVLAYQRVSGQLRSAATLDTVSYIRTVWEIARDNNSGAQDQFDIFYPGDEYVDICSINNYNRFGVTSGYSYYNSFGTSFKPAYDQVRRIAPTKPLMVGETSSTPGGSINKIVVTNGGSGYSSTTTAKISGNGINASATVQVSGGVIQSVTITSQGQDYSAATVILENTGGGTGAVLTPDIRGSKFSKSAWFYDVFQYVKNNTDILYLTFFFENKNLSVADNRQWAPNSSEEKEAWHQGYGILNTRVKETASLLSTQVIRKNLCPDPRIRSLDIWKATGTNIGTLRLSTNQYDLPDNFVDSSSVLSLSHNGTAGAAVTNRVYFTLPYSALAPNQNITISFDARAKNNTSDASTEMFVQPGVEMVDPPGTFERNYPPFRITSQFVRYSIVVNNGQYSPSGWRICWRIGTSTMNGSFQMTNIKVEYGEVSSPLSYEENVVDASPTTKGILQLAGDLAGTASLPSVPNKIDTVQFGLWHTDMSLPTAQYSIDQTKLFEAAIKNKVDMIIRYANVYSSSFASDIKPILDAGYKVQFFLEPTNGETTSNLDMIIDSLQNKTGAFYTNFYFFFKDLAADERSHRVILCMFHEANGDGFYPWQAYFGSNTPAKLKLAYTLTIQLARSLGVLSKFAQIYLTRNSAKIYNPFSDLYVGDEYIDYVGVTDYNRQGISYGSWRYPGMLLKSAYAQLVAMSVRPVMIAESNCVPSHDNFSRAQWFEQYRDLIMSDEYSRIASYSLFSEDKSSTGDPNWHLTDGKDLAAISSMVSSFKRRTEVKNSRIVRQINKNLLADTLTETVSGWTAFGTTGSPILSISSTIPDWFDSSERSLKIAKPATSGLNPMDCNFYYVPTDYSFWKANQVYTLTFWAKASANNVFMGVGVREHGNTFQIYADYTVTLSDTWKQYVVSFATDIPFASGIRIPWFALGQNDGAIDFYISGIKLEFGHQPTVRFSRKSIGGIDRLDNTRDSEKPISVATQQALDTKLSIDAAITKPVNFNASKNQNILAIRNTNDTGHNIASVVFESQTTNSREIQVGLQSDAIKRFSIETSGRLEWGKGENDTRDTFLYRSLPKTLRTDGTFVTGKLRVFDNAATGRVLTSDGQGAATWQAPFTAAPLTQQLSDYTISKDDFTILGNAFTTDITFTLPSAIDVRGKIYHIKKVDSSTHKVIVQTISSQRIDSSTNVTFYAQYEKISIQSDGSNWWVI